MLNFNSFPSALSFVESSSYFLIFLLMVFEGPIITAAAAFASSLGIFNLYFILTLSFLGNIFGDLIYFFIGRVGKRTFIFRHLGYFRIDKNRINYLESIFKKNFFWAMIIIKLVPNLGGPGLILVGSTKVDFKKFFVLSVLISLFSSLTFGLAGFYMGATVGKIIKYSNYAIWIILFLAIVLLGLFFLYKKFVGKIYERLKLSKQN